MSGVTQTTAPSFINEMNKCRCGARFPWFPFEASNSTPMQRFGKTTAPSYINDIKHGVYFSRECTSTIALVFGASGGPAAVPAQNQSEQDRSEAIDLNMDLIEATSETNMITHMLAENKDDDAQIPKD